MAGVSMGDIAKSLEWSRRNVCRRGSRTTIRRSTPRWSGCCAGRPAALFCMSDDLAMRALRVARRCGLSIPDDLAVVGYAGLEMAEYANPPLTTVAEPFEEVGRSAFRLMRSEIENPDKPSFKQELCEQLPVRLLVRESTKGGNCDVAP